MSEPTREQVQRAWNECPAPGVVNIDGWWFARPPGAPAPSRLHPSHSVMWTPEDGYTVTPSIHYDPGGHYEWHGWLTNDEWVEA